MRLFTFWSRPISHSSTQAIFREGLTMAFYLSLWWLAGTVAYYSVREPDSLTTLAIVFFGTTFFAIPSCILGGFSALGLYTLFSRTIHYLTEIQAVLVGVLFGVAITSAVFLFSQEPYPISPPKVAAAALYLAFCGRLSVKIYETLTRPTA